MPANYLKLETLLESKLDSITAANVRRFVELRASEDEDLDFKREPYGDGQDFAVDVASMANTKGGLLVIGIDEQEGKASQATPFKLTDEGLMKMKQWLAELVVPYVPTVITRIADEGDPTMGYFVVVVPKSLNAPHAVRRKGTLRYSRRDGPRNHPLSESEVADRYRDRFRGERAQVDRFVQARTEGAAPLVIEAGDVWMMMTLVPNAAGSMTLSMKRVRDVEQWARQYGPHPGDGPFGQWSAQASTGVRRVVLTSALQREGPPRSGHIELHEDGAGFAARLMPRGASKTGGHLASAHVVQRAAGLLNILAGHAVVNSATSGDALVCCELRSKPGEHLELGWWDSMLWERHEWTRPLVAPMPPVGTHTINLDMVVSDSAERLAATRLLVTELVQAFGLAEVLELTPEGHVSANWLNEGMLNGWRTAAKVPRVEFNPMRGR